MIARRMREHLVLEENSFWTVLIWTVLIWTVLIWTVPSNFEIGRAHV